MFRNLAVIVLVALVSAFVAMSPVQAQSLKVWSAGANGGLAASYATSSAADTTDYFSTSKWPALSWICCYEGDSATVTIQGSEDATNWYAIATKITDGVDGTYAMQWTSTISALGTGGTTYLKVPPPAYSRVIFYMHDKVGSDTVSALTIRLMPY